MRNADNEIVISGFKEAWMQGKEVLVLLTDRWADWEAAYAVAGIKSIGQYDVRTIAVDKKPKASIGGDSRRDRLRYWRLCGF